MMTDNEGHHILSLTAKYHSIWSKCKEMLITIIVPTYTLIKWSNVMSI